MPICDPRVEDTRVEAAKEVSSLTPKFCPLPICEPLVGDTRVEAAKEVSSSTSKFCPGTSRSPMPICDPRFENTRVEAAKEVSSSTPKFCPLTCLSSAARTQCESDVCFLGRGEEAKHILQEIGYKCGSLQEPALFHLHTAKLFVVDLTDDPRLERAVSLSQAIRDHYMAGSDWVVLALKMSPVWDCVEYRRLMSSSQLRVSCDLCAYGGETRRPVILVSSRDEFKRLRWSCQQHEWRHHHSGNRNLVQTHPAAFMETLSLACAEVVDGADRLPYTRVHDPEERLFPCHVLDHPGISSEKRKIGGRTILCENLARARRLRATLSGSSFSTSFVSTRPPPAALPPFVNTAPAVPHSRPHFIKFHSWINPERKRRAGEPVNLVHSRRLLSSKWAVTAGVQQRRTAVQPIILSELEPGEAISQVVHQEFPFNVEPEFPPEMQIALDFLRSPPEACRAFREQRLRYWQQRAEALLPKTLERIARVDDELLRNYFERDIPKGSMAMVGQVPHFALWEEMLAEVHCPDRTLVNSMIEGFRLSGPIQEGSTWPKMSPAPCQFYHPEDLPYRAWGTRQRVKHKLEKRFQSQPKRLTEEIWRKSIDDVSMGFSLGPFKSEQEVTDVIMNDRWIAMPRFPVEQSGKVRPVDDASPSGSSANSYSSIVEKLQVPTIDYAITTARYLHRHTGRAPLGGWTVDESSAFRQIPIHPSDRGFAVVSLCNPDNGKAEYFVMVGHPFGLTSSVYNYCRRSTALTNFIIKDFRIAGFGYFDDRFGITHHSLACHESQVVIEVCRLLGVRVNDKTRYGERVNILGVSFNFKLGILEVLEERRQKIREEIIRAIDANVMYPGQAAKLKGRLMFVCGHYRGRHGRPYLRALAERQHTVSTDHTIDAALRRSLCAWLRILDYSPDPRRLYVDTAGKPADCVIFTDGAFRDARPWVEDDDTPQ